MSSGKVKDPPTDDQLSRLGQVERADGSIFMFHNSANLKDGDPVIFNLQRYELLVQGKPVFVPIALLDLDENGEPEIAKPKWSDKFKEKWDKQWESTKDVDILRLNLKGKAIKKSDLKTYASYDDVKRPFPLK